MNDKIGALWIKSGAKGEYLSGNIEVDGKKIGVVCFRNTTKKNEKQPDWDILVAKAKEVKTDSSIPF